MPPEKRAKQFMPFDALKGFREALSSREKPREKKLIHGEDAEEELNRLLRSINGGEAVTVKYYFDENYASLTGQVTRNDKERKILTVGETQIDYEDINIIEIKDTQSP